MPPVHPGMRFDCGQFTTRFSDAHALLLTDFFVGHFTAAEADCDFDLVTFFKESAGVLQLNVEFMLGGFGAEFDLFYSDCGLGLS